MNQTVQTNNIEFERKNCTCEFRNLKALGKNEIYYSICDSCSESLYLKRLWERYLSK